uniref:Uncharacterized protein n=1 Tax=Oryza meridionalis TaxID=40149 RepID=A0A0E0D9A8_9ORYZ
MFSGLMSQWTMQSRHSSWRRWRPSEQKPMRRTRLRWCVLLMVATSILNCFSPCSIPSSCFTATTVRFASTPRYTAPNPPAPSFSLNPLVDRCSSRYENCTGAPEAYSSSAYCADAAPYLGLCRQNTHHSAHSHSTSPDTAPSTTTATTHPRTPDALPDGDPPPPRGGLGIPGKQTLTNDVLGSAADWYPLTKLDTLRKQRPEPSESAVEATHELPERQLRRQAVMPTKNCSVVISGG